MRVKTFEAASMQEALDTIKREMGEEAFILSTKTKKKAGGLGLREETLIEVTAATDDAAPAKAAGAEELKGPAPLTYGLRPALEPTAKVPAPKPAAKAAQPAQPPTPPPPPMDLQPIRRELLEIKGAVAALKDQETKNTTILRELDELKGMMGRLQKQGMPPSQLALPPAMLSLYGDLVSNDLEPMLALRLCEFAQRSLMEQEGHDDADVIDPEKARLFLRRVIADYIPVASPIQLEPGKTQVAVLVGPTGVGKTTTLAKLAAYAQLHLKQKVALVTLDTYRLAAVDQLQEYARILQVPVHVALTVEDLRSAMRFYQDRSLVLVDTPGHSPKDETMLAQLRTFLDELPNCETHLVLSATTKPRDLAEIAQRYDALKPTRMIFTKLDETSTYGPLLGTLVRVKRPLSYLATGQEVPEALEMATSRRVADLILPNGGTN
ncbi:MAG TPA: flagellar biosynthesis protein FlhF [Holophagaceae bacterium]|nr:flagellar biosynthesis protein FlhF [Holophagaceae bacterium]